MAKAQDRMTASRAWWFGLACAAMPVCAVLLTTLVGLHPARALRDPAAYMAYPFYVGMFSHIGVLGWWTAAAACLLAAMTLPGGTEGRRAMAAGALLSAALAGDDLFMVHDSVMPDYLGLPELLMLGLLGLGILAYLWRFRALHLAVAPGVLGLALVLFGLSETADLVRPGQTAWGWDILLEDGAKLGGIGAWAAYHLVLARALLLRPRGLA